MAPGRDEGSNSSRSSTDEKDENRDRAYLQLNMKSSRRTDQHFADRMDEEEEHNLGLPMRARGWT